MWSLKCTIELRKDGVTSKDAVFEHAGEERIIVNFFWAVVQHLRGWNMTERK